MNWKKATKKPVEVEFRGPYEDPEVIETIEGEFEVDEQYIEDHGGYVIIRGVDGEIYPCALDIFNKTYDHSMVLGIRQVSDDDLWISGSLDGTEDERVRIEETRKRGNEEVTIAAEGSTTEEAIDALDRALGEFYNG